jgi:hypothetical protein
MAPFRQWSNNKAGATPKIFESILAGMVEDVNATFKPFKFDLVFPSIAWVS